MASTGWRVGRRPDEGVGGFAFRATMASIGIAAVVFGALAYADLLTETPASTLAASQWLFAVIIGLPAALGLLSFLAPAALLRRGARIYGWLYLITLAVWAIWGAAQIDPHGDAWVLSITAIPAAATMAGWPRPITWLYLPVEGVLITLVAIHSSASRAAVWEGVLAGLYDITFGAFFVGSVFVALVWTQRLDERLAVEADAQIIALAAIAERAEHERFDALVHDGVISTLLIAARGAASAETLAEQATHTLTQLSGHTEGGEMGIHALAARLREVTGRISSDIEWTATVEQEIAVPPEVADAFVGATSEAIRNVRRHAGPPSIVRIRARLSAGGSRVEVSVSDDGVGFEPEQIPPERMGIRGSIEARMRSIGGEARVDSEPGRGTTIELGWGCRNG